MVSFRSIVAAIALSVPAMAVTTPAQVVANIKMLTDKSQALQAPAQSISIINGPLIIIGQGPFPQLILGFADIVATTTTALADMKGMAPVPEGAESDAIFDGFREFVRVHQVLLNIIIGKGGLFSTVPFIGIPIATALREVEKIVDAVAFALIDSVQGKKTEITMEGDKLGGSLDMAIKKYEGLSIDGTVGGIFGSIAGTVTGSTKGATSPVGGVIGGATMTKRFVDGILGGLLGGSKGGAGGLLGGATSPVSGATGPANGATDAVGGITGGSLGGGLPGLGGSAGGPVKGALDIANGATAGALAIANGATGGIATGSLPISRVRRAQVAAAN